MREPSKMQRLLREKALGRYLTALEHGDITDIIAVLEHAEHDRVLERMILEVHESYQTEEAFLAMVQEEHTMDFKEGLHKSLPKGELPETDPVSEPIPMSKHSKHARWFQVLAAALLVVCLVGGFLLIQTVRKPPTGPVVSAHQGWCSVPIAGFDRSMGEPALGGIDAVSANDIWIVGGQGGQNRSQPSQTLVEHWNGTHLSVIPSLNSGENGDRLTAVTEISPDNVWAVGSMLLTNGLPGHPLIEHWDGHQWSIIPSPDGLTSAGALNELSSVAAASADDIWAVGDTGSKQNANQSAQDPYTYEPLVEHWDGTLWSVVHVPASFHANILRTVLAPAKDAIWVVGYASTGTLIARWDGRQWSVVSGLDHYTLQLSARAIAPNDIWVTGVDTAHRFVIAHWDGTTWQMQKPPADPFIEHQGQGTAVTVHAMAVTSFQSIWAVGSDPGDGQNVGQIALKHWNGQNWKEVSLPQTNPGYLSVLALIGNKVWVAGTIYIGDQQIPSQLVATTC